MSIKFDLRTSEYIERERRRSSLTASKIIVVIALIFFASSSIFYIASAMREIDILNDLIDLKNKEFNRYMSEQKILLDDIRALKAREQDFIDIFNMIQDQPPILETLKLLEENISLAGKISIKSIRFFRTKENKGNKDGKYTAEINAVAEIDEYMITLVDNLNKNLGALNFNNFNIEKISMPVYSQGNFRIVLNYF